MKNKEKYYEILSDKRKYRYGIFPFTERGFEEAEKYIKKLEKVHGEKFFIREK
tara:strand:- start:990 stop:1148 length:159 start_codon:yes stop_codon:yes gene_type:complete